MSPRSKKIAEIMRSRTREAILSASLELFAKRGYSASTTEEIAKKAGISKGLIFTHFDTKQDILLAIFDEEFDRILPRFLKKNDPRPPKERLISLVDGLFEIIKTEPLLVRLSLQLNLDDEYRKLIRDKKAKELFDAFLSQLKKLFREMGSDKPELDSFILMFMFDGIVANYTVAPKLFPIDAIKDRFVGLLISRWGKPGAHT